MYIWIFAALVAYFIKGLCGFANTLIFTSILSFGVTNANISPIDLLLGYPSNVILAWKERKNLDPKVYLPLIILILAGSIPGTLMLKYVDTRLIKLIFGGVVVVIGSAMFLREYTGKTAHTSKLLLGVLGIASGVLCGLFGVGALLAAYVGRVTNDNSSFKANISAVLIADNTFRLFFYSVLHILKVSMIKTAVYLFPVALLGLFLGMKCSYRTDEKRIRKLTAVLLVLSGISLIIKNII